MGHRKTISVALYECKVQVIVCSNILKVVKNIYKNNNLESTLVEDCVAGYAFRPSSDISKYYMILGLPITVNTFHHELSHIVDYITEDRDIIDGESRAWISGYLGEEIYNFLRSKKVML